MKVMKDKIVFTGLIFVIFSIFSSLTIPDVFADTITLCGEVRDFLDTHRDMEYIIASDPGIALPTLGGDGKPVYAGLPGNPTTHSAAEYDQWYHDDPVNITIPLCIVLDNTITPDPFVYTFDDQAFFPIDDEGWGNQGRVHNFHYTYHIHSDFTYSGGESFSFTGDDDLLVFVEDQLQIDLGGVHAAQSGSFNVDSLGLTLGQVYTFDLFFAERHTTESHFRIDTSIDLTAPQLINHTIGGVYVPVERAELLGSSDSTDLLVSNPSMNPALLIPFIVSAVGIGWTFYS